MQSRFSKPPRANLAAIDGEPAILHRDRHGLAILDGAGQQQVGQRILQFPLNDALERPRAIDRVVAGIRQPGLCRVVDCSAILRSRAAAWRCLSWMSTIRFISLRPSRLNRMISSSRLRNSGRNERRTTSITCSRAASAGWPSSSAARYSEPRFEVSTMMRVAEIDGVALAVGQPAVVQHLQQDVEDVGVRLLDLVEAGSPGRAGGARPR